MPDAQEVEPLRIVVPHERVDVRGVGLAEEFLLACLAVQDEQTVPVGLVAVALHALPGDVAAVGRVLGIGVISHVSFGDVARLLAGQVVDVDVRVGGDGVVQSRLLAAGVGPLLAVGAPGQLLDASPGLHGAFVGLAFEDVLHVADGRAVKVGNERVGGSGHPFVPVLVHQVGDDDARRLVQVGIFVLRALYGFHLGDKEQLLAVGAEGEAFDVTVVVGNPASVCAVGVHLPHLAAAAFAAQVGQLLAILYPGGLAFVPRRAGDLLVGTAVGVHHEEFGVALVLGDAVVGHRVGHLLAVGRGRYTADASHGPQGFGCHAAVLDADVRPSDQVGVVLFRGFGRAAARSHRHDC